VGINNPLIADQYREKHQHDEKFHGCLEQGIAPEKDQRKCGQRMDDPPGFYRQSRVDGMRGKTGAGDQCPGNDERPEQQVNKEIDRDDPG